MESEKLNQYEQCFEADHQGGQLEMNKNFSSVLMSNTVDVLSICR